MGSKNIEDLLLVETEHMLGTTGPLVKMRAESDGMVMVGQMPPEAAREIASHLMEAAARSEYEADLLSEMQAHDWKDEEIGTIFHMVRAGEIRRQMPMGGIE
jgi:hypothetical protein